jgi:hypothetical protein
MCFTIDADDQLPPHQRWDDHPAHKYFEVIKDLGAGAFSQVVLARHRESGRLTALKVVFMEGPEMDDGTRCMLVKEGEFLRELSHPNLVKCSDVIESPRAHVFVLEYLRGCNVLDGLRRLHHTYTERDAAVIFIQLASVVAYMHQAGVIHRDIKPENLQYRDSPEEVGLRDKSRKHQHRHDDKSRTVTSIVEGIPEGAPVMKLIDLGMAIRYDPKSPDHGALGSAGFVAPEIIRGKAHTPAMDVFSMGVLLFIMLVGRKPFNIVDSEKLAYARMELKDAPGLKDPRWLDLSPDAKDLLMRMLAYDPARRLTAAQVLQHEWVTTLGGRVSRLLGADVALGAATVAEMRRLRFLCNGVVALQRAAAATALAGDPAPGATRMHANASTRAYKNEFKRLKRKEASVHGGARSLRGIARVIAAKSFATAHDAGAGASVHGVAGKDGSEAGYGGFPTSTSFKGGGSLREGAFSTEGAVGYGGANGGTMKRSATSVMLSEALLARPSRDPSLRGGKKGTDLGNPSGLQLLGVSLRQFVDVSVRNGRAGKATSSDASRNNSKHGNAGAATDAQRRCVEDAELLKVVTVKLADEKKRHGGSSARSSIDGDHGERCNSTIRRVLPMQPL